MKKILMGTTAIIALATFTSEAAAADKIALGLGGFQRVYAGKISRAETADTMMDAAAFTNSEVYITGKTTLDNGVSVSSRFEFEADGSSGTTADNTDESSMTVSSDAMGALVMGATSGAGDKMAVGAPSKGPIGFGDPQKWDTTFSDPTNGLGFSDDKSVKAVYLSPDFGGISVGLSYTPGEGFGGASDGRNVTHANTNDGTQISAAYSGEMSGATVDGSLTYENNNAGGLDTTGVGVNVGMSGFTVGGEYNDFNGKNDPTLDGKGYSLGVAYETGATSVAATYYNSKQKATAANTADDKNRMWQLGVGYDLGAGVGLVAEYYSAKSTTEAGVSQNSKGLVAGIEVSF